MDQQKKYSSINSKKRAVGDNSSNKSKPAGALGLLSMSAMAIHPDSQAAVAPDQKELSLRISQYQEEDVEVDKLSGGSAERYGIDVFQLSYLTPYQENYAVKGHIMFETMSGASAFANNDNGDGTVSALMSGASIDDSRLDLSTSLTKYARYSAKEGVASVSKEKDYMSISLGFNGSLENRSRMLTLLSSFSVSYDQLSPTDPELALSREQADGESKHSASAYLGFTRVLSQYSTLQLGMGSTFYSGFLSDPYRIKDQRPDSRLQTTFSANYRTYFSLASGMSWHLNYRYYQDDWDVVAHTVDTSIWLTMGPITFAPNARFYQQSEADFYTLSTTVVADGLTEYSDDYRLSDYGARTYGLDVLLKTGSATWQLGFSQYQSKAQWGADETTQADNPSLVDFTVMSLGLAVKY